jgi:hypothetical protein
MRQCHDVRQHGIVLRLYSSISEYHVVFAMATSEKALDILSQREPPPPPPNMAVIPGIHISFFWKKLQAVGEKYNSTHTHIMFFS